MPDRPDLDQTLVVLNNLHSVSTTLTEFARDQVAQGDAARLSDFEEVPELLAHSLVTALQALPEEHMTDDRNQLLGALRRFLDGWTP